MLREMSINPLLILASNSPRRQHLLREAGFDFIVQVKDVEEDFPADMPARQVPEYLARKKAEAFEFNEIPNEVVITADTVVILDGEIMNKPKNEAEAFMMLSKLSGRVHEVVTGVCLRCKVRSVTFSDITTVHFRAITEGEIEYYIKEHKPFDKAGAYGAQEWMGMVAIERIEGSYFNVMGLPVHKVYTELRDFMEKTQVSA